MTAAPAIKRSTLKAFLNAACGNAESAREAIAAAGFELEAVQPRELEKCLQKAIGEGTKRILVAGGDGTIATAGAPGTSSGDGGGGGSQERDRAGHSPRWNAQPFRQGPRHSDRSGQGGSHRQRWPGRQRR